MSSVVAFWASVVISNVWSAAYIVSKNGWCLILGGMFLAFAAIVAILGRH